MKQKKIGTTLYVFATTAYQITEDTDAAVIKIQQECIPAYAALNASLVSKFSPINYKLFCVQHTEWSDYYDDLEIIIAPTTNGTVTASPASADMGEEVTITTTPAAGYELDTLTVMNGDVPVTVTNNKFTMPAGDVTITATFKEQIYSITNFSDANGNTVHAELYGQPGVTITEARTGSDIVLVDNGVHIDADDIDFILTAMNIAYDGSTHDLSDYRFTMPAADVTINATFHTVSGGSFDKTYFTIESRESNNSIIINPGITAHYEISTDGGNSWDEHTGSYTVDHLDMFDNIMVRSTRSFFSNLTDRDYVNVFSSAKDIKTYGNIMSLIYGDSFLDGTTHEPITEFKSNITDVFRSLFTGCTTLVDAKGLALPATTLVSSCYRGMFDGCATLQYAPKLPATTLADSCYKNMFNGCVILQYAPELPATTLANNCYSWMFQNNKRLTTAPDLNATTYTQHCYDGMFRYCSNLNHIQCLLSPAYIFTSWVDGVAATGTFVKNPEEHSWPEGKDGIPTGWTVTDYVEPTP